MKILYCSSEVLPFSSSGGLADVIGSLPKAVYNLGNGDDIRVISPLYSCVSNKYRDQMKKEAEFSVKLSWRRQYCAIFSLVSDNITYYFVDNEYYFKRDGLYGHYDDGERFSFFSAAVLQGLSKLDFYPDVLHANDWQTALTVIYLKTKYSQIEEYADIKAVFSIHNIMFQGIFDHAILGDVFDLDQNCRSIVDYRGCINLMKGAIVCADHVVTVSDRYAKEIQTPEYSEGLDIIIRLYSCKLSGILNGIDYTYYDPHTDKDIIKNYTYRSIKRKKENKADLQYKLGLPVKEDVPLISVISRLTEQKGLSLIYEKADELLWNNDVQFVVLGCGDPYYENWFRGLEQRHPDKVKACIMYDKAFSKQLYASSDLFLMPSKAEPCGLSQMIASRYGAVPIVRETGGLYDSIKPYRFVDGKFEGNGFTFADFNSSDMLYVIKEALEVYKNKEEFEDLAVKVMKYDFSWTSSAKKYEILYKSVTQKG